jgi:hypothetical protein
VAAVLALCQVEGPAVEVPGWACAWMLVGVLCGWAVACSAGMVMTWKSPECGGDCCWWCGPLSVKRAPAGGVANSNERVSESGEGLGRDRWSASPW